MSWHVLIRFGELGLKGKNRSFFERTLQENLKHARRGLAECPIRRLQGRLLAGPLEEYPLPLARALARVFGVSSVSIAHHVESDLEAIATTADAAVERWMRERPGDGEVTFKVDVRRADKSFPLTSMDTARELGARLLPRHPRLKVKVREPELLVEADIRVEGTFVYAERIQGPGGLPVGTQGTAMLLLSGGIDSPVAGWLALKRGVRLQAVHFDSHPYTGEESRRKVEDLTRVLSGWGAPIKLHMVPFTAVQEAITEHCNERYHTVLFRRAMHRIAEELARREGAGALITGEALGQVASQTLENLALTDQVMGMPVLRPLVTYDKQEAIAIAERIGTFEISVRPFPDCCTVFTPKRPIIKGKARDAEGEEAHYPMDELLAEAVEKTTTLRV